MMSISSMRFKRGQVWHVTDSDYVAERGIQSGTRPYVIISSDEGNKHNAFVTALACTGKVEKAGLGINVIYFSEYSNRESVVLCNQVKNFSKDTLIRNGKYMETLPEEVMEKVNKAYMLAMGIPCVDNKPVDMTKLKELINEITDARVSEIKSDKEVTEDMVLDIATGLETIFSDVLRDHRERQKNFKGSLDDVNLGMIRMQVALNQKEAKNKSSVGKETTKVEKETPKVEKETPKDTTCASVTENSKSVNVGKRSSEESSVSKRKQPSYRKPHGYWTDERMIEYIKDKQTMRLTDLVNKWEVESSDAAMRLYYFCRKNLTKKGVNF